jgi:diguanylate cyclase (GGDEF)-like protein
VQVRDDGALVLGLLGWSLGGMALRMALTALGIWYYSRELDRLIVAPVLEFGGLTRSVRDEGSLSSRLPPASVKELDALATDFNALLAAVQEHQTELLCHQADLRTHNENLFFQTSHDGLAGSYSRACFEDRLEKSVQRARQRGTRLGVLFVDADRFKQVNDEHGHDAGDRVLCELAERLQAGVRESDVVARLGSDEFVILIEPLRAADDMQRVQSQLLRSVEQGRVRLDTGEELALRINIGGAIYPEDSGPEDDVKELLRVADAAMYSNKQARRSLH